jgi:hypothetical protein
MHRLALILALTLSAAVALAQSSDPTPQPMPFTRDGVSFALPVTAQPQTYAIEQPAGTMSYRGANECAADIVVTSVVPAPPVTTQPIVVDGETIPNVRLVTSPSPVVNRFTGTFFFARTARNFGSSPNPAGGTVRYVSTRALAAPPAWCAFRMLYGRGN